MKKVGLVLMMLFSLSIHAQETIDLFFTGVDQCDHYIRIDSVTVENITRGWSETLFFPDTVYTLEIGTGIRGFDQDGDMQVMPTPFDGQTRVNIFSAQDGPITIVLVDVNGKKCAEYTGKIVCGNNFFEITATTPQVYVLSVTIPSGTRSLKMVNKGHAGANRIRAAGNSEKAAWVNLKSISSHDFDLGDKMRYTGFASKNSMMLQSEAMTKEQYISEDIQLQFIIDPSILMTVTTDSVTSDNSSRALCYGTLTSSEDVDACGFCWDALPHPTVANNHTVEGIGSGSFSSILEELNPKKWYYVRSYATGECGTTYGNEFRFRLSQSYTQIDTVFLADGMDCGNGCAYVSLVNVTDFSASDIIQSANDIGFVRLKIEHSYVGDLWIALHCPNGQYSSILRKYNSTSTSGCVSAIPESEWGWLSTGSNSSDFGVRASQDLWSNPCNQDSNPMGTPWNYVWSNNTNNGYQYNPDGYVYSGSNVNSDNRMDSSNVAAMTNVFHPEGSFSNLVGCPKNGIWSIEIVDGVQSDNGWVTEWELVFDIDEDVMVKPVLPAGPCPETPFVTDYDGNTYNTVQIGDQCWMRENLRTTHYADGTAVPAGSGENFNDYASFYYDNSTSNVPLEVRGYYYTWHAVMNGANSSSSVPSGVQGVCPTGWHVPSDAEWTVMEATQTEMDITNSGLRGDHAGRLAGDYWNASPYENSPGNAGYPWHNASGFSAVSVGNWGGAGFFSSGENTHFWSSTQRDGNFAIYRQLYFSDIGVRRTSWYKRLGFSVRCLRD